MPRHSDLAEPLMQPTREYQMRLRELRYRHPHIPVHELQHFLNHPPSLEAPAKPTPAEPPKDLAHRLWPGLK
jgi:hypothetical protein